MSLLLYLVVERVALPLNIRSTFVKFGRSGQTQNKKFSRNNPMHSSESETTPCTVANSPIFLNLPALLVTERDPWCAYPPRR